jgi:hypothetical protein
MAEKNQRNPPTMRGITGFKFNAIDVHLEAVVGTFMFLESGQAATQWYRLRWAWSQSGRSLIHY